MKPLTIPVVLAGASLTVLAIAAKATSLSLDFSRTVNNTNNNPLVSSGIKIDNANNIYVVDGINNALEALDTSAWYSPPISPDETVKIKLSNSGDIYFLDGINNTLQVLDDTSIGLFQTGSSTPSANGNAFLLDEFNKSIEITNPNTTGLIASSGRRNGSINLPNSALESTDDYYVVDGFNNNLEITNRDGGGLGTSEAPLASIDAIDNFFTGGSSAEDLTENGGALASNFGGESSTEPVNDSLEGIVNDIAGEPNNGTSDADLEAQIIDSIGNPNQELGWTKNLSEQAEGVGKKVSLQRSVSDGDLAIDSLISGTLEESGNFYLVDGFNNALQVIKTQAGLLVADDSGVYLVDGTNNRLQVSDIGSQFSSFGSNSSSASYQENQASLRASGATGQNNAPDPDFMNFLDDYSNGDVAPNALPPELLGSEQGELSAEGISLDFLDTESEFVFQTDVAANKNEDFYQAEEINNLIELVNKEGDIFTISDGQFAVDGSGNVVVIRGINNRIRIPGEGFDLEEAEAASVPEPSSVIGLVLLGSGATVAKCRKKGNPGNTKK